MGARSGSILFDNNSIKLKLSWSANATQIGVSSAQATWARA